MYYYRARYYSAELGRFISRDPIGITDDINLYVYVGNNPVMYRDPSGEVKKFSGKIAQITPYYDMWGVIWGTAVWVVWLVTFDPILIEAGNEWVEQSLKNFINPVAKIKKAEGVVNLVEKKTSNKWVDLFLKYKQEWTKNQRCDAKNKCDVLSVAETIVTKAITRDKKKPTTYRNNNNLKKDQDVDHMVDLQLWGKDTFDNIWPLDSSVNRSLWKQIQDKIKNLPEWTRIKNFFITD